ncbi:Ig-like domain-containing protein [Micromonospora sp. NBC_01699]|uniref:Ig-like domain-containing protein n=1 Tax=Micromonospora sp. NBC_01699 TaxID=2975984 RepID=UPI002E2A5245|nr:Ig-like domain-containing protein [Micromonospora sp. NBC_01699]
MVLLIALTWAIVTIDRAGAAVVRPFGARFQTSERGDVIFASNTLVTCTLPVLITAPSCASARAGAVADNDNYLAGYVDIDTNLTTLNSSSATLSVPAGGAVLWAGLYWFGSALNGDPSRAQIRLARTGQDYTTVTGTVSTGAVTTNGGYPYSAFADVTALVQAAGVYTVAGLATALGTNARGGWAIVAAVRDYTQPLRNLAVFDGYAEVNNNSGSSRVSITLSNFRTPTTGAVSARVGAVSSEGDLASTGDSLEFNGVNIGDGLNPATNLFNSSITRLGSRVTAKTPDYANQLGFDVDYLAVPASAISNGQTSASVAFTTGADSYEPIALFTAIDVSEPDVDATKTAARIGGGTTVNPGDQVRYTIQATSTGNESATGVQFVDPVPSGTTYMPGTITVGGSPRTDAVGDDVAHWDTANNRLVFRLGTGANATVGGTMTPTTSLAVTFRVRVIDPAVANLVLSNQATGTFGSPTTSTQYTRVTDDPGVPGMTNPTLTEINDAPIARDDTATVLENESVTVAVLANDTDAEGDALTIVAGSRPTTHGNVSCTSVSCTYTPDRYYFGFDSFAYTAIDPGNAVASATVSVTINPRHYAGLSISVPDQADLGTAVGGFATGQLGTVTVTDDRGPFAGDWVVLVSASDFVTGTAGASATIPNDLVTYWSGPALDTTGSGTFVPQYGAVLAAPQVAAQWTGDIDRNSASWDPTLSVELPEFFVAGTYQGTITFSIL